MAKYRGPEEFFEAFQHADRPKTKLPQAPAEGAETGAAEPHRPVAQPVPVPSTYATEGPGGEKMLTVRYSTVGASVVAVLLLMVLSFLVGRGMGAPDRASGIADPGLQAPARGDGVSGSEARTDGRTGTVAGSNGTRSATGTTAGANVGTGRTAGGQPPTASATGKYELQLASLLDNETGRVEAAAMVAELNAKAGLLNEGVKAFTRKKGRFIAIRIGPFASDTGGSAKRVETFVKTVTFRGRKPYAAPKFYELNP